MSPAALSAIISLVEAAIADEPAVQAALTSIFTKTAATPADWQALRAAILAKSYKDYVPASALPA